MSSDDNKRLLRDSVWVAPAPRSGAKPLAVGRAAHPRALREPGLCCRRPTALETAINSYERDGYGPSHKKCPIREDPIVTRRVSEDLRL